MPHNSSKIINWNAQWAKPESKRGNLIRENIFGRDPEVVCITEGYDNFLPDEGNTITSQNRS